MSKITMPSAIEAMNMYYNDDDHEEYVGDTPEKYKKLHDVFDEYLSSYAESYWISGYMYAVEIMKKGGMK